MTVWRVAADSTHLYPGARLRCVDEADDARFGTGDLVRIEFADGRGVTGTLLSAGPEGAVLAVPAWRTASGHRVEARVWQLVPDGRDGRIRVGRRLPPIGQG